MTQSVELLLDDATDTAVRAQWDLLGDAGLPTARRTTPSPSHAPHITLWAGDSVGLAADADLPQLFTDLDLELVVGSPLLFGPHRAGYVLVRQVVASRALLELQQQVGQALAAPAYAGFADGQWSPHVTLARRVAAHQVGPALQALAGSPAELVARVRDARRWDSEAKVAWSLTDS